MYHSPITPVTRFSRDRPYIAMTKSSWQWESVKWSATFQPNYKVMPSTQPNKLYLVDDFGGGRDGRVWLAVTKKGEMCVIKFDHTGNREALEKEAKHWQHIWGKKEVQVITLCGRPALMMPYMKPIEDWNDAEIKKAIVEAAEIMARKGLVHNDLTRRHVGFASPVKKGAKTEVVFFDLRDVTEMDETEALNTMIKKLEL